MTRTTPFTATLLLTLLVAGPAMGDEMSDLRDRVIRLEQRIAEIEKQLAPVSQQLTIEQQRETLKRKARERMAKDSAKYTEAQLAEAEALYQVANRNWRSPEAQVSLKVMVEKYPDLNRTGCAVLYLGQMAGGEDQEKYLKQAVEGHSDCFYLDGVQVGAYARLQLAQHYLNTERPDQAAVLLDQIRADYPDAIDHRGQPLSANLPQIPVRSPATQPAP
jgi:hypothetical protein